MNRLGVLLFTLLFASLCCAQEENWELFHAPGADGTALLRRVSTCLPNGVSVSLRELPSTGADQDSLQTQRDAIAAGVHSLPCLSLRDSRGPYAVLPISGIDSSKVDFARKLASSPQRDEHAEQRLLVATLFYLCSLSGLPEIDPALRDSAIDRLQEMTELRGLSVSLRQFIALNCLYPALLQKMCVLYAANGSHSPQSEQIFLQSVTALEKARDLDPLSPTGRRAHELREQLRAARLRSKRFD